MGPAPKSPLSFAELKKKQRRLRDGFHPNLGLRIHRSLSWLHRAELAGDDLDARFIFLWIAFNAAYADENPDTVSRSERTIFENYFKEILKLDTNKILYEAIWTKFTGPIRLLLDNHYVFQPFWNHHNRIPGNEDWNDRFQKSKRRISEALANQDTNIILTTLFDRLYVLRNQMIHGGATWNSSVNRNQVRDGAQLLNFIVPVFLDLMMNNADVTWGPPNYPVILEKIL